MVRRSNLGEAPHKGNERFEGYCIDLLKLLAKNISGFEYDIFVSDGNKYVVPKIPVGHLNRNNRLQVWSSST